jgi:hypothetical protein
VAICSVLLDPGALPGVAGQPERTRGPADRLRKGRHPLGFVQHRARQRLFARRRRHQSNGGGHLEKRRLAKQGNAVSIYI